MLIILDLYMCLELRLVQLSEPASTFRKHKLNQRGSVFP
jgi:hypothetical protein